MLKNKAKRYYRLALSGTLALVLALSLFSFGCSASNSETPMSGAGAGAAAGTGTIKDARLNAAALSEEVKQKYSEDTKVNYDREAITIERDHEFLITCEFDPQDMGYTSYSDVAALYYDKELTQRVSAVYDWADDKKQSYIISPWEYPVRTIYYSGDYEFSYGFDKSSSDSSGKSDSSGRLFKREAYKDWGNTGTLYLATWVDTITGEKLDKPSVQVVNVKGELDTPDVTLDMTDDGLVQFSWNEVKGAKAYYVVEFSTEEDGEIMGGGSLIGQTDDTAWTSESMELQGETYFTNKNFVTYSISEDDWLSPPEVEAFGKEHDPKDGAVISEYKKNRLFAVVAVNETGSSMFSRMFDANEVASIAPSSIAYNMDKLSEEGFSSRVKGVLKMPAFRWIVLCNGALAQRVVNYDFSMAKTSQERVAYFSDDMETIERIEVEDIITIPYIVDGTSFNDELIISEYDTANWQSQLEQIEARQEGLREKTGDVKRTIGYEDEDVETDEPASSSSSPVSDSSATSSDSTAGSSASASGSDSAASASGSDSAGSSAAGSAVAGSSASSPASSSGSDSASSAAASSSSASSPGSDSASSSSSGVASGADQIPGAANVTASSALSEFLAINMLGGVERIDLSSFPEAADQEYLIDAWREAYYQNPLILGVADAGVSRDGKTLALVYEDDQATREKKQAEIIAKVEEIVPTIIKSDMSALTKEFAINEYLCATAKYDDAALQNAAQYDYLRVDDQFRDSFTAYGVLAKGVGVCSSYSAAFKLLADASGLDCMVVTGYLNGSLGHAWNRVALGDNVWATIDSTNNDNNIIYNALLNVPDAAVATTLVEDDAWAMNGTLNKYSNESSDNEFYHVLGLFMEKDAVATKIANQLASGGIAVVRTDYNLTDAQFIEICREVYEITGNADTAVCYWMGVIVMTDDPTLFG